MAENTTIYTPDAGASSVNSMLPWLMGNRGGFGGNGWSDLIALLVVWASSVTTASVVVLAETMQL